jgi:hypothetical protein
MIQLRELNKGHGGIRAVCTRMHEGTGSADGEKDGEKSVPSANPIIRLGSPSMNIF